MPGNKKLVFCAVAGVTAGWIMVSWLDLATRQVAFGIVLVTGLYLLVSLRRERNVPAPSEEAREWLDRFLVEQQDKK